LAGIVVGIETEKNLWSSHTNSFPGTKTIDTLEMIVLAFFTFELIVKIVAEDNHPENYFKDSWNVFDFSITSLTFILLLPALERIGTIVAMLRLLRILRILKLLKQFPGLRIVVESLLESIGSSSLASVLLFVFIYVYAIIGIILFAENDPQHFGSQIHYMKSFCFNFVPFDAPDCSNNISTSLRRQAPPTNPLFRFPAISIDNAVQIVNARWLV